MHPVFTSLQVWPSGTSGRRVARYFNRTAGFTIVEVAFAAAVLALAIASSITAMQHAYQALDRARKITLAGQVMQSEFEKMRLKDWDTVNGYAATLDITDTIDASFKSETAAIANSFTLTRAVTDVRSGMKQITLTTTWQTHDGRSVSKSYTTYYGKEGLYDYFYNSY